MSARSTDLPVSRIVGANVASLRTAHGWSQRRLARQTELGGKPVSFSAVCRMEKSIREGAAPVAVCIDDVVALADALGVTPQQLITPPDCRACMDRPPPGFTCRTCHAEA